MKKADFKPPVLRGREPYTLPDSGEVFVRGIGLGGHIIVDQVLRQVAESSPDEALQRWSPQLLALAVVDEDGEPLMNAQEWADYANAGRQYKAAAFELFSMAFRLSGFDLEAAEKNS
jgi:hypothetical protein